MSQSDNELLERYVDGNLADGDTDRLRALLSGCPEARARLRTLATVDFGLQDIAAASLDGVDDSKLASIDFAGVGKTWSWPVLVSLAIATSLAVFLGTAYLIQQANYEKKLEALSANASQQSLQTIVKVTGMSGVVLWTGEGGRVTSDLKIGSELTGGTIEGASPTSWVELEFLDGSKVAVLGDSRLTFSDFGQKILHLKEGNIASNVNPQSPDSPMLVHTRTATLEVVGTQFNVESELDTTSLNVTEGNVRLKRLVDGRTVDVPANNRVVASGGAELDTQAIPNAVSDWKSNLQRWPDRIWGKWSPKTDSEEAALKLVPYLHITPEGDSLPLFAGAILVSGCENGLVVLKPDSKVRVRGRVKTSPKNTYVVFGLTVQFDRGLRRDNFMMLDPVFVPDEQGRFDLTLNAKDLRLDPALSNRNPNAPATTSGSIVEAFFCTTATDKAGLEIESVEIFQNLEIAPDSTN
ncbi:MAG: FecR domain-containing protein [Mariniblastus sp.]